MLSDALKNRFFVPTIAIIFVAIVSTLFVYLNNVQTNVYIDEEFHFGQTLRYCQGKFLEWDKKITTLPGLYVITFSFLAPFGLCSLFLMRCVNLLGTFANFYLIYSIIGEAERNNGYHFGLAITLTLFPPLFFWFFLYYTDVLSVTFVLLSWLMHQRECYKTSAVAGGLAVLMRQTNIIWIGVLAAERAINILEAESPRSIDALISKNLHHTFMHGRLIWNNVSHHLASGPASCFRFIRELLDDLRSYVSLAILFALFVLINNGIVVGDRTAHKATLHIPQIFYYSVFSMLFAWPYMFPHFKDFLRWTLRKWTLACGLFALATIIVHYGTLVHPYVLADNRHYVFYIWNRFLGRYAVLKYLLVPVYGFAIYAHFVCLKSIRFLSQIIYASAVSVVLIPQLLLEPRYFIIPYLYLRLNMGKPEKWQLICEFTTTLVINVAQFYIFINKTFYWTDDVHPQRISW